MEDIEARHQREKDDLERQIADMLAAASGKNERKRLNKQAEQMRRDLFERQSQESPNPYAQFANLISNEPAIEETHQPPPSEEATKQAQKKAAQRAKREKKMKDRMRYESQIENIVANQKTPGAIETEKIEANLEKLGFEIRPVIGDGNCLFRAFAISLSTANLYHFDSPDPYIEIRKKAADELRAHIDVYKPFSNFETDEEYENHCKLIETTAEWGDSLEVLVLAKAYNVTVIVHTADNPPEKYGTGPNTIQLSFHSRFTSSGGHFNAVIPKKH